MLLPSNKYTGENSINTRIGYGTSLSSSNDFYLNKKKNLSLNISYWYAPPQVDEIWDVKAISNLSASIQWSLLDKKLRLALEAMIF